MEASFVNPGHKLFLRNGLSISNWRTTDWLIDLGSKESRFDELLFAPGLADLYTLVLLGRKDTGSRRSVGWYSEGLKDSIFFIRQKPVSVKKTKEGLVSGQGAHGILSSAFHQKGHTGNCYMMFRKGWSHSRYFGSFIKERSQVRPRKPRKWAACP